MLDYDFGALRLRRLYRVSDQRLAHRAALEAHLYHQERDLFSLCETAALYDLTNTCCEGTASGNSKALVWTRIIPTEDTLPGVYCLRTNQANWDERTLWDTYTMRTDREAVFRSLKSELGLRPIYHHKSARVNGHLFISVLAYHLVVRSRLMTRLLDEQFRPLRVPHVSWLAGVSDG